MEQTDYLTSLHDYKLSQLGPFKSRVIKIAIWQQDAEVNLGSKFLRSCIFAYILCTCASFDSLAFYTNLDIQALSTCYEILFMLIYIYWMFSIGFYCYLYRKSDLKRGDNILIVGSYISTGFVYLGYPLFMRILLSRIVGRLVTTKYGITSTNVQQEDYLMTFLIFVSGAAFVGIFLFLMRNRIPSQSVDASCIDSHREASVYCVNMFIIILDTFAYRLKVGYAFKIVLQLILLTLIVGNLTNIRQKRLFWSETFNEYYTGSLCVGYLVQIIYALLEWKILPTAIFSLLVLFATLAARAASNLIRIKPVLDVFSPDLDPIHQREAILSLEYTWVCTRDIPSLQNPLRDKFIQFVGKISKLSKSTGAPNIEDFLKDPYTETLKYLENIPNLDTNHYMLETLLIFQLAHVLPSLVRFNLYMRQYEKSCDPSMSGMLNYYRIADLFELKIKMLYRGRIAQDDPQKLSVRGIYHNLNVLQKSSDEDNFIDLCMIVRRKHEYRLFCQSVENMLSLQAQQFTLLESSSKKLFSKLFQNNKNIKLATVKADNLASEFINELDKPQPTYPLMGAIYYFRVVRHQVKKANDLFLIYKAKRSRLINASIAEGISPENMLKQGAIFECSLQSGSVGNIVDYSPDIEETLGKLPTGTQLEGVNINIVFPKLLQAPHTVYMEKMESFPQLNLQRMFFINGFDGNLREVKFLVKFVPKIQKVVTAIVYTRPVQIEGKMMLILSQTHQIIAAQEKFWKVVGTCQTKSKLKNMHKLSPKVCKAIEIFKAFEIFGSQHFDPRDTKLRIVRRELLKIYDALTYCNNIQGLEIPIEHSSPYYHALYNLSIVVNIHFLRFKHILLTKLYMKFELISDKSGNSVMRLSSPQGGTITPDHVIQESKLEDEMDRSATSSPKQPQDGVAASPILEHKERPHHQRFRTSAGVDKSSTNRNLLVYIRDCLDILVKFGVIDDYIPGRHAHISSKCEFTEKSLLRLVKLLGDYEIEDQFVHIHHDREKPGVANFNIQNFHSKNSDPDSGVYHGMKTESASHKEASDQAKEPHLLNLFGVPSSKLDDSSTHIPPLHKSSKPDFPKKKRDRIKEPSIIHNSQILYLLGFHNGELEQVDSKSNHQDLQKQHSDNANTLDMRPVVNEIDQPPKKFGLFAQVTKHQQLPLQNKALMKAVTGRSSSQYAHKPNVPYEKVENLDQKKPKIMGVSEKVASAQGDAGASPKKKESVFQSLSNLSSNIQ